MLIELTLLHCSFLKKNKKQKNKKTTTKNTSHPQHHVNGFVKQTENTA